MQIAIRERLPDNRDGSTHRFEIRGKPQNPDDDGVVKGYLTVNTYEDGRPAEIFVRMAQMGSTVSGFIDAWAVAVSILLQTGTAIEIICDKYRGAQFEPAGLTGNPEIPFARSPIDYIVRWLEQQFVGVNARAEVAEPKARQCEIAECEETEGVHMSRGRRLCEHHRSGKA